MQIDRQVNPYNNFRFKVKIDGKYVAGFNKVSGLNETAQPIERSAPGEAGYTPLILERGVTQDLAFSQWCNKVWDYHNVEAKDPAILSNFRKNIGIEVYNDAGEVILSYTIYNAWSSKFLTMPELNARENSMLIQSLTLQHEGWKRNKL